MNFSLAQQVRPIALSILSMLAVAGCGGDGPRLGGTPAPAPPPPPINGDCPIIGNLTPTELSAGQCEISGVLMVDAKAHAYLRVSLPVY